MSESAADNIADVRLKRGRGSGLKQPKSNTHRVHWREKSYLKMYADFRKYWTGYNAGLYAAYIATKQAHEVAVAAATTQEAVSACGPGPHYQEWSIGYVTL
jgi:hypothetical protein